MKLMEILSTDEEIIKLKAEYHKLFDSYCSYNNEDFSGINDYKAKMRKAIEEKKTIVPQDPEWFRLVKNINRP